MYMDLFTTAQIFTGIEFYGIFVKLPWLWWLAILAFITIVMRFICSFLDKF